MDQERTVSYNHLTLPTILRLEVSVIRVTSQNTKSQNNTYTITFNSNYSSGANYVIQVTGQGAVATVLNTNPPTATGFRVVLYSAATTWPTTVQAPFSFSVLH